MSDRERRLALREPSTATRLLAKRMAPHSIRAGWSSPMAKALDTTFVC